MNAHYTKVNNIVFILIYKCLSNVIQMNFKGILFEIEKFGYGYKKVC